MARPNAVEASPFRDQIEEYIKEGKPDQFISDWLKEKGSPISRPTINKYRNNHFNITEATRKKYAEQERNKRINDASDQQLNDLNKIDDLVNEVDPKIMKSLDPKDQVKAIPQLLNTKYKILGVIDEGVKVETNLNNTNVVVDEINDLFKEAEKGNKDGNG